MIAELSDLMLQQEFNKSQHIPSEANQLLALARNSISSITTKILAQHCMRIHQDNCIKRWNNKLNELTIQCKFSAITELESQIHVWKCIQNGLPTGQL